MTAHRATDQVNSSTSCNGPILTCATRADERKATGSKRRKTAKSTVGEPGLQIRSCYVERRALSVCGARTHDGADYSFQLPHPSGPAAFAPRLPVQACINYRVPTSKMAQGWTSLRNALTPETLCSRDAWHCRRSATRRSRRSAAAPRTFHGMPREPQIK